MVNILHCCSSFVHAHIAVVQVSFHTTWMTHPFACQVFLKPLFKSIMTMVATKMLMNHIADGRHLQVVWWTKVLLEDSQSSRFLQTQCSSVLGSGINTFLVFNWCNISLFYHAAMLLPLTAVLSDRICVYFPSQFKGELTKRGLPADFMLRFVSSNRINPQK